MRFRLPIATGITISILTVLALRYVHAASTPAASSSDDAPRTPPSVGLEIGQPAPAFVLPDQFGNMQSNETLKGSNGTVLLFFRSADW